MKNFLIILYFLVPVISFSQKTKAKLDTCFTQQQIKDISFTVDSLFELADINDEIIFEQKVVIRDLKELIKLDSTQIDYHKQQTALLRRNIDLYIEKERITNKWYNNKYLWLSMGVIGTFVVTKAAIK
jgi:hypothetical protein